MIVVGQALTLQWPGVWIAWIKYSEGAESIVVSVAFVRGAVAVEHDRPAGVNGAEQFSDSEDSGYLPSSLAMNA